MSRSKSTQPRSASWWNTLYTRGTKPVLNARMSAPNKHEHQISTRGRGSGGDLSKRQIYPNIYRSWTRESWARDIFSMRERFNLCKLRVPWWVEVVTEVVQRAQGHELPLLVLRAHLKVQDQYNTSHEVGPWETKRFQMFNVWLCCTYEAKFEFPHKDCSSSSKISELWCHYYTHFPVPGINLNKSDM